MPIAPRSSALNPDVVCSPLADGAVLFDLSSKQYYALNATGMLVWQWLEDGAPIDVCVATLEQRYPDVGRDAFGVREFGSKLEDLGLAERGFAPPGSAPAPDAGGASPALPPSWARPDVTPHGRPLSKVILSPFDPTVPVPE